MVNLNARVYSPTDLAEEEVGENRGADRNAGLDREVQRHRPRAAARPPSASRRVGLACALSWATSLGMFEGTRVPGYQVPHHYGCMVKPYQTCPFWGSRTNEFTPYWSPTVDFAPFAALFNLTLSNPLRHGSGCGTSGWHPRRCLTRAA
jgi:hypothetical protein